MRQLLPGDIIWRNIRLATMDPQRQTPYGLVDNHALIVREGGIVDIIPQAQLPVSGDNIHDMQGRLVTPGLIDCHTHLIFAGNRADEWEQRLNGVSYQHISAQGGGINATVSATRACPEETLYLLARERMMRLRRDTKNAKTGQRKYEKTIFRILCVKPPKSGGFLSMI